MCFFILPLTHFFVTFFMLVSEPPPSAHAPEVSPTPLLASSPSQGLSTVTLDGHGHPYHLTLIPGVGIAVTVIAVTMLVILIILIHRKNKELENFENNGKTSSKGFLHPPRPIRKLQEGPLFLLLNAFLIIVFILSLNSFSFRVWAGGTETAYRFFIYVSEV